MPHDTPDHWFPLVRDLTLKLVRFPSITNTPGEVAFAQHLYTLLAAHPYFQANPGHLRIERAPDDPRGRSNVFALVRGGPRTVVLTGHYDVVSIENYGDLAPYACLPEALLPRLVAELEAGAQGEADQLALQDLRSGDYLPGRGALDMKSGLAAGEVAPPPVCLKQADLKAHYDVTTPAAAWCYYNLLTYSWAPSEALAKIVRSVQEALDAAMAELRTRMRRYAALTGSPIVAPSWQPRVLTFAELKRRAIERAGADTERALAELDARLADDLDVDLPTYCLRTTELLWKLSGLTGPAVVVGLASLYYPRVSVGETDRRHVGLREAATRQIATLAHEMDVTVRLRPFFPAISDMS